MASRQQSVQGEGSRDEKASPPVHRIQYGNIAVAIWANESNEGDEFYNVTVKRGWKDDEGNWHDATSFGFLDLPLLAKALLDAHSWIAHTTRRARESKTQPSVRNGRR